VIEDVFTGYTLSKSPGRYRECDLIPLKEPVTFAELFREYTGDFFRESFADWLDERREEIKARGLK
jgi:hypothetical protein